eukprot:TRINITY_DN7663_c0_g1_i5.p1 TRINITY_DN7663_c0_g1~~TRINITY_DN7663_c0_g1_i5.p1  ORF type:complete len:787 (-),score=76.70 TRINITY_DN7663_c0_g1_i5:412-2772(-)
MALPRPHVRFLILDKLSRQIGGAARVAQTRIQRIAGNQAHASIFSACDELLVAIKQELIHLEGGQMHYESHPKNAGHDNYHASCTLSDETSEQDGSYPGHFADQDGVLEQHVLQQLLEDRIGCIKPILAQQILQAAGVSSQSSSIDHAMRRRRNVAAHPRRESAQMMISQLSDQEIKRYQRGERTRSAKTFALQPAAPPGGQSACSDGHGAAPETSEECTFNKRFNHVLAEFDCRGSPNDMNLSSKLVEVSSKLLATLERMETRHLAAELGTQSGHPQDLKEAEEVLSVPQGVCCFMGEADAATQTDPPPPSSDAALEKQLAHISSFLQACAFMPVLVDEPNLIRHEDRETIQGFYTSSEGEVRDTTALPDSIVQFQDECGVLLACNPSSLTLSNFDHQRAALSHGSEGVGARDLVAPSKKGKKNTKQINSRLDSDAKRRCDAPNGCGLEFQVPEEGSFSFVAGVPGESVPGQDFLLANSRYSFVPPPAHASVHGTAEDITAATNEYPVSGYSLEDDRDHERIYTITCSNSFEPLCDSSMVDQSFVAIGARNSLVDSRLGCQPPSSQHKVSPQCGGDCEHAGDHASSQHKVDGVSPGPSPPASDCASPEVPLPPGPAGVGQGHETQQQNQLHTTQRQVARKTGKGKAKHSELGRLISTDRDSAPFSDLNEDFKQAQSQNQQASSSSLSLGAHRAPSGSTSCAAKVSPIGDLHENGSNIANDVSASIAECCSLQPHQGGTSADLHCKQDRHRLLGRLLPLRLHEISICRQESILMVLGRDALRFNCR